MLNQVITATITLAGRQGVQIDTHGTGGPGSMITVVTGCVLLRLHDRDAVKTYTDAWLHTEVAYHRGPRLPEARQLGDTRRVGDVPGLTVHAHGTDDIGSSMTGNGALAVHIGKLTWVALDRDAYQEQVQAWTRVGALAALVLPARDPGPTRAPRR